MGHSERFSEIWFTDFCSELYGNSLNGRIPATLGNLTKLVGLDLYENQLSGPIPATIGAISTLRYLYANFTIISYAYLFADLLIALMFCRRLYENKLTGAIPTSLGNLINLQELKLQKNALSGSIPSSLGNIKTLQFLYVILPKFTDNFLGSKKNACECGLKFSEADFDF